MKTYYIAFPGQEQWDIVETFEAENDKSANAYADANYADQEWWVLNAIGQNINGHPSDELCAPFA